MITDVITSEIFCFLQFLYNDKEFSDEIFCIVFKNFFEFLQ